MQIVSNAYKAYMSQPVRPPFHMEITVHTDTPIVYTDSEIFEFEEKKTAHPIGAELPTIEVSFKVDNIKGDYDPDSPSGMYEQLIKGVKVTYRYGLEIPNIMPYGYPADAGETEEPIYGSDPLNPYGFSPSSTIEWIDGGEVYTTGEISYDKTSATIEAVDALSFLEETADVAYGTITRKQCAEFIIGATEYPEDALGAKKISIDNVLETWQTNVVSDKNAKQVLQSLAHASGVQMYIDRSGYLHLDKIPITTDTVDYHLTLGDQDEDGEFTKGKTPRKVVVKVNTKNVVPEVSETINPKGEDILVENDFVQTTLQAEAVLPWVKRYLDMRNTAEIEYAGDPSLDVLDIVLLDTEYSKNIQATIVESTIHFDGAITGSLVLRYDSTLTDNTTVKITGAENFIYSGETPSPASVTLVCETDMTAPSYEWSYFNDSSNGWQVISGATTANLTILADSAYMIGSNPTSFRVVVRGGEGAKGTTVRIQRVQEAVTQSRTYLGKLSALPSAYDVGDYFLVSTAFGTYGVGDVVQWDGDSWEVTDNTALIVTVYQDALTLSMPLENTSAVNQYIRSIQTKQILLSTDTPVILYSSRGELKTNEVLFTVTPINIDYADIVWTCNLGDEYLEDILDEFGNPIVNQKAIVAEGITEGPVVVTVYAIIDGITYSASYSVAVVSEGSHKPMYLDARADIPLATEEGPLAKGDYFLYIGEYDGPNTEPVPPTDKTNPLYLNPTLAETNEFIYGRMYEYIGKDSIGTDLWNETRKSECFASAQKDALEIAKNSGVYLYVAVVVAQLGLFNDLLVANKLSSTNYDEYKEEDKETNPASPNYNKIIGLDGKEHEVGEPKKGFKLDGPEDVIKAFAMEAYNSKIFGTVESTGFKTLTGTEPVTIPVGSIPKTLWKYSDMFNYIVDQETLYSVSGTIDGFTFNSATKRFNTRIKITSQSPNSSYDFGAGDIATMGIIYPDFVFGRSIYVIARGKYDGNYSARAIGYAPLELIKIPNQPLQMAVEDGGLISFLGKSFDYRTTLNMPANENLIKIQYGNNAWWGNVTGYLYELSAYTNKTFNGLVLRNGDNIKVIEPKSNAYYPNTITWDIGANNQNTLSNYVSGTEFYNRFYELPSVVDGYVENGKIKIKKIGQPLTEYTVTRLVKDGNGISFYTNLGIVRVDKFSEETSSGVYEHLEITQDIEFKTVPDGIEVKSVLPWGTFIQDVENVTIGTKDARFGSGYFRYLDVLANLIVGGTLNVTDIANVGSINTGGLGNFLIGQNLRQSDNVIFNNIEATGSEGTRSVGSYVYMSRTSESSVNSVSYTRVPGYAFKFKKAGVYTVIFRMRCFTEDPWKYGYARIYVNSAAVGTERKLGNGESANYSQNITLNAGDVLEIRAHGDIEEIATTIEWCYINQNQEGPIYV